MMTEQYEPPFDGKPCPMCPREIRNLAAVAHNLLNRWNENDTQGVAEYMRYLQEAVDAVQPLSDAHFAHRKHSHGA